MQHTYFENYYKTYKKPKYYRNQNGSTTINTQSKRISIVNYANKKNTSVYMHHQQTTNKLKLLAKKIDNMREIQLLNQCLCKFVDIKKQRVRDQSKLIKIEKKLYQKLLKQGQRYEKSTQKIVQTSEWINKLKIIRRSKCKQQYTQKHLSCIRRINDFEKDFTQLHLQQQNLNKCLILDSQSIIHFQMAINQKQAEITQMKRKLKHEIYYLYVLRQQLLVLKKTKERIYNYANISDFKSRMFSTTLFTQDQSLCIDILFFLLTNLNKEIHKILNCISYFVADIQNVYPKQIILSPGLPKTPRYSNLFKRDTDKQYCFSIFVPLEKVPIVKQALIKFVQSNILRDLIASKVQQDRIQYIYRGSKRTLYINKEVECSRILRVIFVSD